jgi:hypothetical protein
MMKTYPFRLNSIFRDLLFRDITFFQCWEHNCPQGDIFRRTNLDYWKPTASRLVAYQFNLSSANYLLLYSLTTRKQKFFYKIFIKISFCTENFAEMSRVSATITLFCHHRNVTLSPKCHLVHGTQPMNNFSVQLRSLPDVSRNVLPPAHFTDTPTGVTADSLGRANQKAVPP